MQLNGLKRQKTHDDIFDTSRSMDTINTLIIDIVDSKEELYRLEKAEKAGISTLAISFSSEEILSDIPLTNVITLYNKPLKINGQEYDVNINLNLIKLKPAYYSEYMKILTIDAPNLPKELKSEVIKFVREQILSDKQYLEYINPLENIAVINFESANGNYEKLTDSKVLNFEFASKLIEVWGDIPILYDFRSEKSLINDSPKIINIKNINAMLSAS